MHPKLEPPILNQTHPKFAMSRINNISDLHARSTVQIMATTTLTSSLKKATKASTPEEMEAAVEGVGVLIMATTPIIGEGITDTVLVDSFLRCPVMSSEDQGLIDFIC